MPTLSCLVDLWTSDPGVGCSLGARFQVQAIQPTSLRNNQRCNAVFSVGATQPEPVLDRSKPSDIVPTSMQGCKQHATSCKYDPELRKPGFERFGNSSSNRMCRLVTSGTPNGRFLVSSNHTLVSQRPPHRPHSWEQALDLRDYSTTCTMEPALHLLDLTDDVLYKVVACLGLLDKCRLESACCRFRSLLLEPRAWTELEAILTAESFSWLHRHVPFAKSLTLKSPLALQSDAAASFEDDVRALCWRAESARNLRLWGPQVALAQLPRQLETLKLDCWRYRSEDVHMLSLLSKLRSLTIHFLGVRPVAALHVCAHLPLRLRAIHAAACQP